MKLFTFYWLNGKVTESYGDDLDGALTNAGHGSYYASVALDFYTEDKPRERHYYDKEARQWVARRKLRFTMAPPAINANIQTIGEITHIIDRFDPQLIRELVGDLSTVGTIDFNDVNGNVIYLAIRDGGIYYGGNESPGRIRKKYHYVGFAEYYNHGYDEESADEYHYLSNGGWYFPIDSEQQAFEAWLDAAAKGTLFPGRQSQPEGSCSFDELPYTPIA